MWDTGHGFCHWPLQILSMECVDKGTWLVLWTPGMVAHMPLAMKFRATQLILGGSDIPHGATQSMKGRYSCF